MEDKSKMPFGHYHDVPRPTTPVKVLLIAESGPENGNYFYLPDPERDTSFFHGIMQAFGFEEQHKKGNETELLATFLAHGYFLIDACPEPVNNLTKKERNTAIMDGKGTLLKVIADLKPEKIVFLCKTNESVAKWLVKNSPLHRSKIVKNGDTYSFPYPGNGWLSRKDGKGIKNLLPKDLKGKKDAKK